MLRWPFSARSQSDDTSAFAVLLGPLRSGLIVCRGGGILQTAPFPVLGTCSGVESGLSTRGFGSIYLRPLNSEIRRFC